MNILVCVDTSKEHLSGARVSNLSPNYITSYKTKIQSKMFLLLIIDSSDVGATYLLSWYVIKIHNMVDIWIFLSHDIP